MCANSNDKGVVKGKNMVYHEKMDIQKKLEYIDSLKKELDGYRPLSKEQAKGLKNMFDVDFTYNSTAIEGNTFTLQETKVVLLEGITIGGKSMREHLEIINHKEAIDYIEELSFKKINELRKTDIFNIHSIILQGIDSSETWFRQNAGKYRDVPVYVKLKNGTNHIFCDPLRIIDEMDGYFNWLFSEKKEHPLIISSEAHTRFVSIHPFIDGNGRTARLLMNLILLQEGYVPAIIKNKYRINYLDAIEEWQQNNNKEKFYEIILEYEQESLEQYLETIKNKIIWK
ncbi:cell division protein Fic [Spirochaetia bacterium]|nr:cell division protein Fic [Spirochaetia bacterium]